MRSNGGSQTQSSSGYVPRARPGSTCISIRWTAFRRDAEVIEGKHPILTALFVSSLAPCGAYHGKRLFPQTNVRLWRIQVSGVALRIARGLDRFHFACVAQSSVQPGRIAIQRKVSRLVQ